jgi:hypothetical protein
MLFKPSPLEILGNFIKGFLTFWVILLAPAAVGILVTVYADMPLIAGISAYGLLGIAIALIRSRKSKIEVSSDLRVTTVRKLKAHPELLTSTLIVNGIFAVQAFFMWIIFIK